MDSGTAKGPTGVARIGDDPSWGWTHSGLAVKPIGDKVFGIRLDLPAPKFGSIVIPEAYKDSVGGYGKHKGVRPWQLMQVLAVGPCVKDDTIVPGDYYIVDPWNCNQIKRDGVWYFFPREGALVMQVPYEGE